jgi:uncharacterized protein (DUF433 family)
LYWRERITSDPQILRGKPCINGTRIPVALVLGYLAAGRDASAILCEFLISRRKIFAIWQ